MIFITSYWPRAIVRIKISNYVLLAMGHRDNKEFKFKQQQQLRKAARICLRLPLYTPVNHSHLLHQLNLPSLYSRRKIKHILLAHSIYYQYAPPHILQLNLPPLTTPIYSLRCQRSYHIPSSRTDRHKDSPVHKSLHLFNLLPEDIKNTRDRTLFKSQISALLTNSVCSCSHHPLPCSP